jgi:hypothetical protein
MTESAVPANAMGPSSSTSGPIQTIDPILQAKKKKLRDIAPTPMVKRLVPNG